MFSSRFRVLIPFSLLALALTATPGYSTTTTYSTFANWQAAATILQTIDFQGNIGTYANNQNLLINGAQFIGYTAPSYNWRILDTTGSLYYDFNTAAAVQLQLDRALASSPVPYFQIILPAATTAFAADLFTSSPNGLTFAITVDGTPFTATTNLHPNPAGFFGITSDTPFTTVNLTLQGTTFNGDSNAYIDNVSFGTAQIQGPAQTPEAATFLLIGSGLLWIGVMRKRARTNPGMLAA